MSARKSRSKAAALLPKPGAARAKAAKRKFEEGLVARGEAVPEGEALPPGATHAIVGTDATGKPILKRKRFSIR